MSDEERGRLLDLLELKDERIAQLEEALRFYADRAQYHRPDWGMDLPIEADRGAKARAAFSSERYSEAKEDTDE